MRTIVIGAAPLVKAIEDDTCILLQYSRAHGGGY